MTIRIGKKQRAKNEDFVAVWNDIENIVPRAHIDELLDKTVTEVKTMIQGKRVAYGWSGGKDSQALRAVMDRVGVEPCLLALAKGLEFPAFVQFTETHRPQGLTTIYTPQDLPWLAEHPEMLFPQDGKKIALWYHIVQHVAQAEYYRDNKLDLMIFGRRKQEGNFMGRDGSGLYQSNGGWRWCPIRDWTHEEVLACCHYYDYAFAPIYKWPRGFIVGTGPWPARTFTRNIEHGWQETFEIDPTVVQEAAQYLPSARAFLEAQQ